MIQKSLLLFFAFCVNICFAQDTAKVVSYNLFMEIVAKNHPVAKQAALLSEEAKQNLRAARGGFDPSFFTYFDNKEFKDISYYNLLNGGLSVPTWFGLEGKAGYERNAGTYINPENITGADGLLYAGASLSLGAGLLMDQRRADLLQAKIFQKAAQSEQQLFLADLALNASMAYWDWYAAFLQLEIINESVSLADFRFNAVKELNIQGDLPAIDTLEAYLQYQDRLLRQQDASLFYRNQTLFVSTFLWNENGFPLEFTELVVPDKNQQNNFPVPPAEAEVQNLVSELNRVHPKNQINQFKIETLGVERRLKAEYLRPKIDLSYNFLTSQLGEPIADVQRFNQRDYKFGLSVSMPLFLRRARGDYQLANIKIKDAQLGLNLDQLALQNKFLESVNAWNVSFTQLNILNSVVENSLKLLEGEQRKFEAGESSLFLINSRELKWLDSQVKRAKQESKIFISKAKFEYSLGRSFLGL